MKSTRKMLALVLALVMCLAFFPASASAAGIMASGSAGSNAEFVLYTDGRLVISGTGTVDPMNQWSFSSWGGYTSANDAIRQTRSEVKSLYIEEGIRRYNRLCKHSSLCHNSLLKMGCPLQPLQSPYRTLRSLR